MNSSAACCPTRLFRTNRGENLGSVRSVCVYAQTHLETLTRRTGGSYAQHGCEVAGVLRELSDDPALLNVAILHDILIHPDGKQLLSNAPLDADSRRLVARMHELRRLHIDADTHDLDRVLDAFLQDERMLFLRMAHRLSDIHHLDRFPKDLRRSIANETLHMYTSIAGRLGSHKWRNEMEDLCFLELYPKLAKRVARKFQEQEAVDRSCLEHAETYLRRSLREAGIAAEFSGRVKGLYSTYRKMITKDRRFEELTDRLALRIVVPATEDCYRALGIVHARLHPIAGKLKDYIGAPKENGYRSIHTVVYPLPGVTGQPIEIQIRTREMHRECEGGMPSHATYKDWQYALRSKPARVNLFRNLEILRKESRTPVDFEQALRTYHRDDHLVLFDEDNRLYHIPCPATVLDFAAATAAKQLGSVASVRVNGRQSSLATDLHDGDIVELRFGRSRAITSDWLHACYHRTTKKMMRQCLRVTVSQSQR